MKRTRVYCHRRAVEIVNQIQYATLATVTPGGRPWNSPVFAVHDEQLNIYWISDREGRHSRNIRANGHVFIVIYDSTVPEGEGEGVYIQATAYELTDPEEIRRIRRIKKGPDNDDPSPFVDRGGVRRIYKAVPEKLWMNADEIGNGVFIRDYRVELSIETVQRRLKRPA